MAEDFDCPQMLFPAKWHGAGHPPTVLREVEVGLRVRASDADGWLETSRRVVVLEVFDRSLAGRGLPADQPCIGPRPRFPDRPLHRDDSGRWAAAVLRGPFRAFRQLAVEPFRRPGALPARDGDRAADRAVAVPSTASD